MDKNKKILVVSLVALGVILIGLILYLVYENNKSKSDIRMLTAIPSVTSTLTATPIPTKTATSAPSKTQTPTPEPTKSADEFIANALYQKFSKDSASLTFSIGKKSDNSAYGSMTFTDTSEGGYFVAAKDSDGDWKIIADGNGTIECSVLEKYNVPASVVEQCYDSNSGESKTR